MKKSKNLPFFVYGTLLPGQPNDYFWDGGIERCQPAVFAGAKMFSFTHFPMIIEVDESAKEVIGKLIWVEEARYESIMADIDQLENYDPAAHETSPYQRLQREVLTAEGETILAWVYIGLSVLVKGLPQIETGDWEHYLLDLQKTAENNDWWRNRSTDSLL